MAGEVRPVTIIGRYAIYEAIAAGGMATVHYGRLLGPVGFSRTVAIKRLHPQYAADPEFVSMFLDEARLAARIRHPHVVPTLDVVATEGELFLVMDYVPGESLSRLMRATTQNGKTVPPRITLAILSNVLQGLHAAHEAKNEQGEPLGIVHRDVSPQNILVGTDGQARVLDFGVAKAIGRVQTTREGQLKGKISYMSPEQLSGSALDRRSDVYSASVVLWEILTAQRLFMAENEGAVVARVMEGKVDAPSTVIKKSGALHADLLRPGVLTRLDQITLRGLSFEAKDRFATAREMALALEECLPPATTAQVSAWVEQTAQSVLAERAVRVAGIESSSRTDLAVDPRALLPASSPSASSGPIAEVPTVALQSSPSHPIPEPSSQLSSVSVVSGERASLAQRSRRGLVLAIGAGAALTLLAIVVFSALHFRRPEPAAQPIATASGVPSEPSAAPEPVRSVSPEPSAEAPVASASSAPSASAAKKPPSSGFRPIAPKPQCNPPYTFDSEGRKHYKPECL